MRDSIDETFTSTPCFRALKCGSTTCIPWSAERVLSRTITSRSSAVTASSDGRVMPWPALFTQTSTPPKRATARSSTRSTSARRVTSPGTTSTGVPSVAAISRSCSSRRAISTREAWRPASSRASPAPMPALAPVTTTTGPLDSWDTPRAYVL